MPREFSLPPWTQEKGRVAIVHDWLTGMRGGEAILDVICELFPNADLYTLLWTDKKMSPNILNGRKVHTSYLQKCMRFGGISKSYRKMLPLFPHAISTFDLSSYDMVLSHSHCVAKAVQVRPSAIHISYISTPMRYIWDMFHDYFNTQSTNYPTIVLANLLRKPLQRWDKSSTKNVHHLIANSHFIQNRIKKYWDRTSTVLFPFADIHRFPYVGDNAEPNNFYLVVSAFAPYKRIDLAIEAFQQLNLPLKIVGGGQDEKRLKKIASRTNGTNIEFLGKLSNEELTPLYQQSKALIFPGLEDFGITPLESMASGRPVIAYGAGGVLDTVTEKTGILFPEQSVESLMESVRKLETGELSFQNKDCRDHALHFSREIFTEKFVKIVDNHLKGFPDPTFKH